MGWFHKLSARAKLLLAFLSVAGIMGTVSLVALYQMGLIDTMLEGIYKQNLLGVTSVKQANLNLAYIGRDVLRACRSSDKEAIDGYRNTINEQAKTFEKEFAYLEQNAASAEEKTLVTKVKEGFPKYLGHCLTAIKAHAAGQTDESGAALKEAKEVCDTVDQACTDLAKLNEAMAKQAYEQSAAAYASAFWMVTLLVSGGTMVGLALGWVIARWFTKALVEVSAIADSVASASQQLAAAAEELSSGAQEQASSLEETAASLEQITGTIQQNADHAQQANQFSCNSRDVAEKGGEVVGRAVQGMSEINAASKKIADIITAIDEIAFQTNLLALNAAVEAARAGEQGRGFAVVAGEVRNLAQRSAAAAKEIKGLIQDSVAKVENGTNLVNQSGQTLEEIVSSVKRVTDIVAEIAAASREQAGGIEQVNRAVTQMDQVTQANASQTEELSSTAESLAAQAAQLQEVVAQFNLVKKNVKGVAPVASPSRTVVNKPVVRKAATPVTKVTKPQPRSAAPDVETAVERELELVHAGTHASGPTNGFEEF